MQLIEKVLNEGKSSIMLVPEISLTPQMIERFMARFGKEKLAVLHSKLSIRERYNEWKKIENGEAKIIIGARSAIFAPSTNLGLIIIDEEHDQSYKSDMTPRYNAKEIAKYIAKTNKIPLVLGSATPDLNTYYEVLKGKKELIVLRNRANNSKLPNVEIIDLKQEIANGNRAMLSNTLVEKIKQNLENKKQTILFLNRRGYSTFVMCRDCGHTLKCKRCNITLTYHIKENKLKCHYCDYEEKNILNCPKCNSKNIRYFGTGTQKLEAEINKMFPNATSIRLDIDTITTKNTHEVILNKFKEENIDILIGTQMIVKGHHFPNVTLVGAVAADSSLYIEDYRSNERTFQILTQVAGRAGRESNNGEVIIQTYSPDNFAITCAKEQNYDKFYNEEISFRRQLNYPPFCDIIKIEFNGLNEVNVSKIAQIVYKNLEEYKDIMFIYKPMPSPINKIKNRYRWRIIIKCKLNNKIIDIINKSIEIKKNYGVKIIVDVNPNSMS